MRKVLRAARAGAGVLTPPTLGSDIIKPGGPCVQMPLRASVLLHLYDKNVFGNVLK